MKFTAIILLQLLLGSNSLILANKPLLQHQKKANTETSKNVSTELDNTISVDIKNVALTDLLKFISDNYGIEFVVNGNLPPIFVTVKVSDVAWQDVLGAVLQAHNVSYQLVDKKCYINANNALDTSTLSTFLPSKGQPKGFGDPSFQGDTITVDVKNVELDSVLRFFSQNFNFSYTLSQALKDKTVTIKVQDQAWNKILENTLKENNLGYNRIGTVVYIFPLKNTVLVSR